MQCTKISTKFEFGGQKSKVKVTRHKKNEKVRQFVLESSSGVWSSCAIFSGVVLGGVATPVRKSAHAV